MGKKKFLILGSLFLLILLLLSGCGSDKTKKSSQSVDSYTIVDTMGDAGFPSPYGFVARGPGYEKMIYLFDTLIWKDDKGLVPALAAKIPVYNERENSYSFELRKDVKWHDGRKFTARDVAFTFKYTEKHPFGNMEIDMVQKVDVMDDYTVKIYLNRVYAPFLNLSATLPILPEHIWKDVKEPGKFLDNKALIGTGPFKLASYDKELQSYLYEANYDYYLGVPKVKKLKFILLPPELVPAALKKGEVNAGPIPPEIGKQMADSGFTIMNANYDWMHRLMINHKRAPLNSKEFRQALAYAINRNELVEIVKRGFAEPGNPGLIPPDTEWYNPKVPLYQYDPEKAREILKGLGYELNNNYFEKNGKALEVELLIKGGKKGKNATDRDGELIKKHLEMVGIKVNLKSAESKTVDEIIQSGQYDLAINMHGGFSGDPEYLSKLITGNSLFSAKYRENKKLNGAIKRQVSVVDPVQRKEELMKIQKMIAEDLPSLPLMYTTDCWAHDGTTNLFWTKKGYNFTRPLNKLAFVK